MKGNLKFLLIGFFFITGLIAYSSFYCGYYDKTKEQNSLVAIFVESDKLNEKGEKQYELADSQSLNDSNYLVNEELSTCSNGDKIVYDESTNSYSVSVYGQDKCDIYLDKKNSNKSDEQTINPISDNDEPANEKSNESGVLDTEKLN